MTEMVPPSAPVPPNKKDVTGLEFLEGISGLYMNQKIELLEAVTGINTKNQYRVIPIGQEMPDPIPDAWMKEFTKGNLEPLFKAKEESNCLTRIICPGYRSFTMPFVDGEGRRFFSIIRPFRCTMGIPYMCICQPQEAELLDANGNTYAKAIERTPTCCGRNFDATDDKGRLIYHVSYNALKADNGKCNACAPSCFNANLNIDISRSVDERTSRRDGFQVAGLLLRWANGSLALCVEVCARFAPKTKSRFSRGDGFD
ncbi:unnamed protein product [Bathycoccus prasinos]